MVKKLSANAGDAEDSGLIPGSGRSPGGRNDKPRQYSCLENPIDKGPGRLQSMGSQKSQTQLSNSTHLRQPMAKSRRKID